jgi:hypothetical protein
VRYELAPDHVVLQPIQEINPGPYVLVREKDQSWDKLIAATRAELAQAATLREVRAESDPARRASRVFDWITAHRGDLGMQLRSGTNIHFKPEGSWAGVELEMLEEAAVSPRPEDAWRALKLWVQFCPGGRYCGMSGLGFSSDDKRELLLRIATDEARSTDDRSLALCQLCGQQTLWCDRIGASSIKPADRKRFLKQLVATSDAMKADDLTAEVLLDDLQAAIERLSNPPQWEKE